MLHNVSTLNLLKQLAQDSGTPTAQAHSVAALCNLISDTANARRLSKCFVLLQSLVGVTDCFGEEQDNFGDDDSHGNGQHPHMTKIIIEMATTHNEDGHHHP